MKAGRLFAMFSEADEAEVVVAIGKELVPVIAAEHRTGSGKVVIYLDQFKLLKSLEKLKSPTDE